MLLVAGGSGITFVLSILEDLVQKHAKGHSRVCAIDVIWSVADPCKLTLSSAPPNLSQRD